MGCVTSEGGDVNGEIARLLEYKMDSDPLHSRKNQIIFITHTSRETELPYPVLSKDEPTSICLPPTTNMNSRMM